MQPGTGFTGSTDTVFRITNRTRKTGDGLTNDRLLSINEDIHGYLWILSYDSTAYRFNPGSEIFEPIPKPSSVNFQAIQTLPNGVTWLLCADGSALRAHTAPNDLTLTVQSYSSKNSTLPSGKIRSIFLDSTSQEWILTDNGLYRLYNGQPLTVVPESSQTEKPDAFYVAAELNGNILFGASQGKIHLYSSTENSLNTKQLETSAAIISIQTDENRIWYVTDHDGLFVQDIANNSTKHYTLDRLTELKGKQIESARITRNGLLWLTHPSPGVTLFDTQTEKFSVFIGKDELSRPLNTETGFFAIEDQNGVLWIHPKGGGFSYYDPLRKQLIPFNITDQPIKWKSNDRCFSAFIDKQGNLWMSTQLNRLKRITFIPDRFHFHSPSPKDLDLPENEIRALFADRQGRIWTGSRDLGISIYDTHFNLLHRFKAGKVYAITQDADGVFWLSTKGEGLIKAVETADGHFVFKRYTYDPHDLYSLSSDNIYYTFQDQKKRLWVATYGGGLNLIERLSDGSLRFINHRNRLKNYPIQRFYKVRHITEDSSGGIWISTTAGILQFEDTFQEPETITFNRINREQGNANSLSNNDVHMIKCTNNGQVFAVTYGGGLNEIVKTTDKPYSCKPFTKKNGLISDIIYAIQEDRDGYLWLATGGGLVKFADFQEQVQYPSEHIGFNIHFSEGIGAINQEYLLFGTNRGVFYFNPEKIGKTYFTPRIFFSSVWVNNEELTPKNAPSILSTSIDNSLHITLLPNNHSLRLVFSALDMTNTEHTHYAYMLKGFDKKYRLTDHGHEANYTNLPPGKYVFHVKSTNSEGMWVDNERTLSIEVLPTFSETPYASMLAFLLILIIGLAVIYIYTIFYNMKQKVKNEKYLAELKLNFFTNVSHELRTPLTLITGPLELVLKDEVLSDKLRESLQMIKKNGERMQRLVGQILDFSKIQDNKMRIRVQREDIVRFTQNIVNHFSAVAGSRRITLTFNPEPAVYYLWFDTDKIEKVIFNILSNAFKYTANYKSIQVSVKEEEDSIHIQVTDQGIGIPKEKLGKLFNRFENLMQNNLHNTQSSGIGLSLAKELTEMHQGRIFVESESGKGSTFTIALLKGKAHYPENTEYILSDPGDEETKELLPKKEETIESESDGAEEDRLRMLIVEDNHELRSFIRQVFQGKFQLTEAQNGSEGLEKAFITLPDIIITDVMMPVKDGIQMLQELRNDERTSHIPAIVLTAKSDMDSVLIGIQTGADDYITKPFSVNYLRSKVDSLLAQRKKLQAFYNQNSIKKTVTSEVQTSQLSDKDTAFLIKLNEVMEEQLSNPDLSVDHVVDCFNLSRTNFFRKLKSLTGLSPVLYIRDARMRKAAELIKEQHYSMAEIAYMVGFSDPHYFSKTFKAFWGVNATEYIKNQEYAKE